MSFNVIDFSKLATMLLPEVRRLPKWLDTVKAVVKPMDVWFADYLQKRLSNIRFAMCDGSIMALEALIKLECNLEYCKIIEQSDALMTKYIGTNGEEVSVHLGTSKETPFYLGTSKEVDVIDVDYIVEISPTDNLTFLRVESIVNAFNSYCWTFEIRIKK